MTNRFINPRPQFLDASGKPLLNAKMDFFENGTLIRKDTFTDVNEKNKNPNPVLLNADGSLPNVFYAGTARTILTFDPGTGQQQRFDLDGVGQFGSGAAFDDFNSLTEYEDGAIVVASDGEIYRSLQNNNQGNDPVASPTFWERLEFIRIFNVNVTYGIDDIAKASNGLIFRSLQADNLNNNPLTSPLFWGTPVAFVDLNILGDLSFAATELTIAAGSVAAETSHHTIDTEADAATDDLDTITVAGVADGTMLFLRLANAARVVTIKDGTGNIQTKNNEDIILDANIPTVLFRVGTDWFEVQRPVVDNPFDQSLNIADDVVFNKMTTGDADINGGAIDATSVGGSVPAAGDFTDLSSSNIADFSAAGIHLGGVAAANVLDDYEEGTFTPTLQDSSLSDAEGQTYSLQAGTYTKSGRVVQFKIRLIMTSLGTLTTTQIANIAGLPFVAESNSNTGSVYVSSARNLALVSAGANIVGVVTSNADRFTLEDWDSATGTTGVTVAVITASGDLRIYGSYTI